MTTEEVRGDAQKASGSTAGVAILQIIIQLCFKGSISKILLLIYCLQLTKSISYFDLKLPTNAQLYLEELGKFVDGEYLKPDYIMGLLGIEFELSNIIDGINEYAGIE